MHIVCEDEIAASFINACLTKRQKNIVCIQGYGGQDELASKAQAVEQATGKKVLVIYDGDVAQAKLNKAKNDFVGTKISVTCLPGSVFPEAYIIEAFTKETIKEDITSEYVLEDAEWHDLKNKLATLSDHHDLFYILSQFFGYDRSSVVDRVCRLVQKRCAEDFEFMKKFIVDILERESKVAA